MASMAFEKFVKEKKNVITFWKSRNDIQKYPEKYQQ